MLCIIFRIFVTKLFLPERSFMNSFDFVKFQAFTLVSLNNFSVFFPALRWNYYYALPF